MTNGREVDLDLLADYIGGALDGTPEAAAVERLIADDTVWSRAYAETSAAMAAVRVDLDALHADRDQMPAEVVGRLEAVLAAVPPDEGGKVIELASRRRWVRRFAPVAVAASVLICVGLGATLLRPDSDRQNSSGTSEGGRAADAAAAPVTASGSPLLPADKGAAKVAPKVEVDSPGAFSLNDEAGGAPPPVATGTDYTRDTLAGLPDSARAARSPGGSSVNIAAPEQLRRLTDPVALTACLTAIKSAYAQPTATVRSVDLARFEGSPAIIVLLPDTVWVSGPDCGRGGPDTRYSARTQGR